MKGYGAWGNYKMEIPAPGYPLPCESGMLAASQMIHGCDTPLGDTQIDIKLIVPGQFIILANLVNQTAN